MEIMAKKVETTIMGYIGFRHTHRTAVQARQRMSQPVRALYLEGVGEHSTVRPRSLTASLVHQRYISTVQSTQLNS